MKFSELFDVKVSPADDWFDPILTVDTRLFVDPFLLYDQESGVFAGSHDEVLAFFNYQFKAIARTGGTTESNVWKKAKGDMLFPEVEELCLGYTGKGTRGSGSGRELAGILAGAIWEAIQGGLVSVRHFEEISLIRRRIGADRISDTVARLLRHRFGRYTLAVCMRHNIPIAPARYISGRFDQQNGRWVPVELDLPMNPANGKPILLSPRRYLRELPTIGTDDFWQYCRHNENDLLRARFGDDIARRLPKDEIIEIARKYPAVREKYISYREGVPSKAYDLGTDQHGLYSWYDATKLYCAAHPCSLTFDSIASFRKFASGLIDVFRQYIEQNRGWALLWNDNQTPRRETACQDLFLGIVKHYCQPNNIDISREPNIGRGPVDFKVSQGFAKRALIEVKKADNTKFWHGLSEQLPTYLKAEEVTSGYFLVIAFNDKDFERIADIQERVRDLNEKLPYRIQVEIVDASYGPPSASKV